MFEGGGGVSGLGYPMYYDVYTYLVNDSINREVDDVEAIHLTKD